MHKAARIVISMALVGCAATATGRSPVGVPAAVSALPAETCGQFELVADKGKATARAATDVRARCDNSYLCAPRVASNRVELHALAPGATTLHLEYTDPATGKGYSDDVPITVSAAQANVRVRYGTAGCSYLPVRTKL